MGTVVHLPRPRAGRKKRTRGREPGKVIPFSDGPLLSAPVRDVIQILRGIPRGEALLWKVFHIRYQFFRPTGTYRPVAILTGLGEWARNNPDQFIEYYGAGQ